MLLFTDEITYNVTILLIMSCLWLNALMGSFAHILNPSIQADIRDYQQYITGERIDGMFSAVGLVGSIVTLATGSISTAIYEKAGLNKATAVSMGYSADNVYDVLFDADLFQSVCSTLIIASVIGAALNVLPFFLYDLTETKQKAMISVLKIRAFFEDKMNNTFTPEQENEVTNIISTAKEYAHKAPLKITKEMSKADKKRIRQDNEQIKISQTILNELDYFNTSSGILEVEFS
jgi:Na+/melibiose symporter-like transporter